MYDVLVRGGQVVLPEEKSPRLAEIAISDGVVAAILPPGAQADAARTYDVGGRLIFPGAVDPHVHVSWPFLEDRTADDYATATGAAALGGTTSILDFAIEGRESPIDALARRRAQAEGSALVDFGFHCVISEASDRVLNQLADVQARGCTSFKLYMTYSRRGLMVDDATLYCVAERAAELGAAIGVHAENGALEDVRLGRMRARGRGASRFFRELKPPYVEAEAVARAGRIVAAAGARLWVLHVSSKAALRAAASTREQTSQPAALETCPQYLLLTEAVLEREDGHRFLCSPPLRGDEDREALWTAISEGDVDWIGSDHCLFLKQQKDDRAAAFWDCPHGLPGIQTRMALILHAALKRGISANRCAELLASGAARFLGLYPRKGTLLPGSDGDLAVWDPDAVVVIRNEKLAMGGDWTPYEGFDALAPPSLVLVRGERVAEGGRLCAPAGHGAYLQRRPLEANTKA